MAVRFALDGQVLSGILWIFEIVFDDWRKDGLSARLGQVRAKGFCRMPNAGTMDPPGPEQSNMNSANGCRSPVSADGKGPAGQPSGDGGSWKYTGVYEQSALKGETCSISLALVNLW